MKIVEVKHPLVKHKLGLMREHDISTKRFRELASEVGSLLTYEATADLETEKVTIEGWNGPVEVEQIKGKKITVVLERSGGSRADQGQENYRCAYPARWPRHDGRGAGARAKRAYQRGRYLSQ